MLLAALLSGGVHAQQSNEDRLREALKRTTADLRALQDSQATLQAQLGDVTKQRDMLQQLLDQARAAPPPPPAVDPAELAALRQQVSEARAQIAAAQAALAKWQAAYREAAALAQEKDREAKRLDTVVQTTKQTLAACRSANTKLIATARDILHLYQTASFRTLVLEGFEPLLGLKRVELDNLVQDYEDKIADTKLAPAASGQ